MRVLKKAFALILSPLSTPKSIVLLLKVALPLIVIPPPNILLLALTLPNEPDKPDTVPKGVINPLALISPEALILVIAVIEFVVLL